MKLISLILITAALCGCYSVESEKTGLEGKPLPAFNLLLPDSATWINTGNIATGKPIVLFYYSPSCPYCRSQTEEIIEDMDKLRDLQIYFITRHPFPKMKAFYKEYKLSRYPNITAGLDTASFINDYFEVAGVPYLAIYGKDKKLNKTFLGKIYSSQIKKVAAE